MNKQAKTKFTIDECYLMMFSEYEDIVTADEVASMLRLPEKRIYRMFRSGELKASRTVGMYAPASCGLLSMSSVTVSSGRRATANSAKLP